MESANAPAIVVTAVAPMRDVATTTKTWFFVLVAHTFTIALAMEEILNPEKKEKKMQGVEHRNICHA
jgi:hypothetical protein